MFPKWNFFIKFASFPDKIQIMTKNAPKILGKLHIILLVPTSAQHTLRKLVVIKRRYEMVQNKNNTYLYRFFFMIIVSMTICLKLSKNQYAI